jgi:hypothetical protein
MWTSIRFWRPIGCATIVIFLAGCEGGPGSIFTGLQSPQRTADSATYRQRYLTNRDPEALRWLMGNAIQQGMTVGDVSEALGQEGEREFDDHRLKTGGHHYRATDVAYRWGPDSNGHAVYLFFRDDKLLNFDPEQFRE